MEEGGLSHLVEAATALANLQPAEQQQLQQEQQQEEEQQTNNNKRKQLSPSTTSPSAANKEIFPVRLMAILNDTAISADIITWLPHGRSFVIVRPDVFTEQVMPLYLPPADARTSTKYPSFTRKLNRWGFRQATRGPDTGAFHHPLFRRDNPSLCLEMVCQRSKDARKKNGVTPRLPAKKRKVAELTEASLQAMNNEIMTEQQQVLPTPITTTPSTTTTTVPPTALPAAVSVSGESSGGSEPDTTTTIRLRGNITADPQLTEQALLQLNEQERLRTAKAMLYHAYLEAVQQQG